MKRRTLLGRLGAATAVTVGSIGTTSARPADRLGIDGAVDVSDVAGETTLAEILDDRQMAPLPDHVEPASVSVQVDADAESVEGVQWCCNSSCSTDCAICVPCDEIIDPIT